MSIRMRYTICYDISSNRRRNRLVKNLKGFGNRVQKSVFEAVLDRPLLDKMILQIQQVIASECDTVLIYPLCGECARKVQRLGKNEPAPGTEVVFVV